MIRSEQGESGRTRGERTRAAILRAARDRFAAQGYERTTIRAVAADAGIDPSMVMRYFGSKQGLFDAALAAAAGGEGGGEDEIDLRIPDLSGVPADRLAETVLGHFIDRWEGDPADDALLVLLRSAVTNEQAAARVRAVFAGQAFPALAAVLGPERAAACAGLVVSQLLGLALTRYLLRVPAVTALDRPSLVAAYAPALRAVLA
ncbi:TetR/AcrR family transcriptional regulator [Streptomyces sp. NPDC127106]|uniref:TetR/AcrR family transcriptional regulator n=1 Tax=Streptomyces sp. NPDC127106 TaxID=3345360 RepID=UPI003628C6EF